MSENNEEDLVYRAFVLGCEVAAQVVGSQTCYYSRSLALLQAIADGEATLLESPTDTAAWARQFEQDRERIVGALGPDGFEDLRLYLQREMSADFSEKRRKEVTLAKVVLRSLQISKLNLANEE